MSSEFITTFSEVAQGAEIDTVFRSMDYKHIVDRTTVEFLRWKHNGTSIKTEIRFDTALIPSLIKALELALEADSPEGNIGVVMVNLDSLEVDA